MLFIQHEAVGRWIFYILLCVNVIFLCPVFAQASDEIPDAMISSAIGQSVSLVRITYPAVHCTNDLRVCSFEQELTPQSLCPAVAPCDDLNLAVSDDIVIGYMANFTQSDWLKSLKENTNLLGPPRIEKNQLNGVLTAKTVSWSWSFPNGLTLVYMKITGVNIFGNRVDDHIISLFPDSREMLR